MKPKIQKNIDKLTAKRLAKGKLSAKVEAALSRPVKIPAIEPITPAEWAAIRAMPPTAAAKPKPRPKTIKEIEAAMKAFGAADAARLIASGGLVPGRLR
jgi:hypothetical protein